MGIVGIGTVTYLYINGLKIDSKLELTENISLIPAQNDFSVDVASKLLKSDDDFAIVILAKQNIGSQLKINSENAKQSAINAWNAQWDIILLSAILGRNIFCNIQCSSPVDEMNENSVINVTNNYLHGLSNELYEVTCEERSWMQKYYHNAKELLENPSFETAVHAMASYRWHSMPRIQLAVLWSGIEAIFGITSELVFRISLCISNYLCGTNKEQAKEMFSEIKGLYKIRSSAVHGDKIKGDMGKAVKRSAEILNGIIKKCAENDKIPKADDLIFGID